MHSLSEDSIPAYLQEFISLVWCPQDDDMPFAFLMTDYMKRLEAGDPRAVAIRDDITRMWRRIVPYLISHRSKEWWQAGYR